MKICCCWLFAISKYGYPPSLENTFKVIREMKEIGFEAMELEGVGEKNLFEVFENRRKIKSLCESFNLRVVNFCPVLPNLVSSDSIKKEKALDLFKVALEIALFFNTQTIQIDSYTPAIQYKEGRIPHAKMDRFDEVYQVILDPQFSWQREWEALVDGISRCNEMAKRGGLRLCLEPRVGENVSNTDAMLRLFDAIPDRNFGAVLDTGHQNAQKEILPLSVEKLGDRIFYVHVSDNDGRTNHHLPLGQGTIDWEGVFLTLKKHKFEGYVAVDLGHIPNIDQEYARSKKFLEDLAKRLHL
jgi:sugar phosphate isomerase/epimerase